MVDIKFTNAAKAFKGEKQQIDAFEYLQKNTPLHIQEEFQRLFRTKPVGQYGLPLSGVELIKEFEGCYLRAYVDPLTGGLPITIGWGSTRRKDGSVFLLGQTITQEEADDLLEYQLAHDYLPSIQKIPYWNEMSENQKGALLSFAYNLGAGFYGTSDFKTITAVLKNKEWNKVADAMYMYRNPGSSVETGLGRRRKAEGALWDKG
jgi:lysozyme